MSNEQVVDAATASEEEVAAALFGDDGEGNEPETEVEESEEDQASAETLEDLPEWAQTEIRRLRRESAAQRVKAREATRKTESKSDEGAPTTKDLQKAEERGREAARLEYGVRLAGAEVRASLAGVVPDEQIADIVEDLNLSRYVDDDGEVDTEAVQALRDKYVSLLGKKKKASPVSTARKGGAPTNKSTADQFAEVFQNL